MVSVPLFINTIVAIIMIIINFTTNIIIVLNVIISRFPVLVDAGSDAVHLNRGDLIFPPSGQLDDFKGKNSPRKGTYDMTLFHPKSK